jgi:hypothetical protein
MDPAVGQGYLSGVPGSFCQLAYDASGERVDGICLLQGSEEVLGG